MTGGPTPAPVVYGEVTATLPAEAEELFALFCFERGALGVETVEADAAAAPAGLVTVRAWFAGRVSPEPEDWEGAYVRRFPRGARPASISIRHEASRDWEGESRAGFVPLPVGERFVICPPWAPAPPPRFASRIPLVIDPAQAFGTGRHESTALAIALLERRLAALESPPPRAADVGAGTGVLALAARKLGVREVHLCDIDPVVLPEIRRNFELSGEPPPDVLVAGGPAALAGPFPLVLANLDAPTLVAHHADLARLVAPAGALIVSGLREPEAAPVLAAFDDHHLTPAFRESRTGWTAVVLGGSSAPP